MGPHKHHVSVAGIRVMGVLDSPRVSVPGTALRLVPGSVRKVQPCIHSVSVVGVAHAVNAAHADHDVRVGYGAQGQECSDGLATWSISIPKSQSRDARTVKLTCIASTSSSTSACDAPFTSGAAGNPWCWATPANIDVSLP